MVSRTAAAAINTTGARRAAVIALTLIWLIGSADTGRAVRSSTTRDADLAREVPFETLVTFDLGPIHDSVNLAITKPVAWREFWKMLYAGTTLEDSPANVDFGEKMVLAVLRYSAAAPYSLEIRRVTKTKSVVSVYVSETQLGYGCPSLPVVLSPARVIQIDRQKKKLRKHVEFILESSKNDCPPGRPAILVDELGPPASDYFTVKQASIESRLPQVERELSRRMLPARLLVDGSQNLYRC
jgi:hypothetical protein